MVLQHNFELFRQSFIRDFTEDQQEEFCDLLKVNDDELIDGCPRMKDEFQSRLLNIDNEEETQLV